MLRRSATTLFVVLLMVVTAAPTFADPPADRVSAVDEVAEVTCDGGEVLVRERSGWYGLPSGQDLGLIPFHITATYTNEDGDTWRYQDTGSIRFYERDGDDYVALSGHSTNVGPDETGWYGHWERNLSQDEVVKLVGKAQGDIDAAACEALT